MEKIAIIGMECLLPEYTNKEQMWKKLIDGECLLSEENFEGKIIERGHLHREESDKFFKDKFSKELYQSLEQKGEICKWSAYVVQEALRESGYLHNKDVLKHTGLIMGALGTFVQEDISLFDGLIKAKMENKINYMLKNPTFVYNNRDVNKKLTKNSVYLDTDNVEYIRKTFGLGGYHLSMSAACATPLYAIKLGCMYLQTKKTDLMVIGSTCEDESASDACSVFDFLKILTESGSCNPLDKNSHGLVISAGAGAVILKRLKDAERDNDNILAVIDSLGWSNDGGTNGILAPCKEGQIASYRDAYCGGVSNDIDYIECHSTGTSVGDMEEYESIRTYFYEDGKHPLIGTLKGSTGHFLTASAMASVAKVILSMQYNIIPKTIRVEEPVGEEVVTSNTKWPKSRREKRAAINAFGFGGINAHLVLKEYRKEDTNTTDVHVPNKKIVITGMDLEVGAVNCKEDLVKKLMNKESLVSEQVLDRFSKDGDGKRVLACLGLEKFPKGAYIHSIPFDYLKFKFPSKNNNYYTNRDLVLLNVANRALAEANVVPGSLERTAVIVNSCPDFVTMSFREIEKLKEKVIDNFHSSCVGLKKEEQNLILEHIYEDQKEIDNCDSILGIIPSMHGSWIPWHWDFKGPSFVLIEEEGAIQSSLSLARLMLQRNMVDCVVLGTSELLGESEYLYAAKMNGDLDQIKKYGVAEGSAVIVLKTEEAAAKSKDIIYGTLDENTSIEDKIHTDLVKRTIGFSQSLGDYVSFITKTMQEFYQFDREDCVGSNTAKYKTILEQLGKNADSITSKVKSESKYSYVKVIATNRPTLEERDAFKDHAAEYGQAPTVNNLPKCKTYQDNFEKLSKIFDREDIELGKFMDEIIHPKKCIFSRSEIVEMTNGSISKILGSQYAEADKYKVRSRMPSPPYLFVSRITKLDAEYGKVRPSSIEIEYDIDRDCIYLQGDNSVSNCVLSEASQIGIFLGAYIGVDIMDSGTLRFRIVSSKSTIKSSRTLYLGDTVRLVYKINQFTKRGDTLFLIGHYECYCGEELLLMADIIGGFFTEEDLAKGKGIISPSLKLEIKKASVKYCEDEMKNKTSYNFEEMEHYFNGELSKCFHDDRLPEKSLPFLMKKEARMIDAVTDIKCSGGKYGLGYIEGEKNIDPSYWAFKAHFKNDPVFPGTHMLNGANQLLLFFAIHFGIYDGDENNRPAILNDLTMNIAFRGQVQCEISKILYRIDVKKVIKEQHSTSIIVEVNIMWKSINVIREENMSLKFNTKGGE